MHDTYPETPVVFVDAGSFAGDPGVPGKMQTDALVEGMNALDYLVANVSPVDLGHGLEAFETWRERAEFEFISANLVWQDSGDPVVAATAIRKVNLRDGAKTRSVRLGFIGLTSNDPAFMLEGPDGRRVVTIDPITAAVKHLPALRKKSDAVIALVNFTLKESRVLPKKVEGIDLILGGHGRDRTRTDDFPEDTKFGRTRIMYIGHQGQNLGEVRLRFGREGRIEANERHVHQLTRDWPEDPVLAELMERTKIAINEHNRELAMASNPFAQSRPETTGAFTGSERCGSCHEEAYAIWKKSRHAHAFDILVDENQNFNPRCVGCHTIGFGKPSGFVNVRSTPGLVHVGCESCHGPSRDHPDVIEAGFGRATSTGCVTCHTKDNSPEFDPATYIPPIRHWADR